ncbi:hypothetical protein RA210_U280027 [Rubrivivax sp. A210]|nr:hypothetical protein RA210_U280027 [Rubrivivax sp. A210]
MSKSLSSKNMFRNGVLTSSVAEALRGLCPRKYSSRSLTALAVIYPIKFSTTVACVNVSPKRPSVAVPRRLIFPCSGLFFKLSNATATLWQVF